MNFDRGATVMGDCILQLLCYNNYKQKSGGINTKQDMAISIMQECQVKFDQLLNPESNVDVGDFLNEAHVIADKYDGVNCAMNVTYINGQISSAICIITDMHPGSVAFIAYPNGAVNLRLVPPEDHKAFAEAIKPFFDSKYPE